MDATGTFLTGPYAGTRMLDWALAYAERGWYVFQVRQGTKTGYFSNCAACKPQSDQYDKDAHAVPGRCDVHPGGYAKCHGFWAATRDPQVIERWWTEYPHGNIAIDCGRSGIACIDVDIKHHKDKYGDRSIEALERKHGAFPLGPRAVTASGGWHWVFELPDDHELKSSTGSTDDKGRRHGLADHVDIKAVGGLMIAAPSVVYDDSRGVVTGQYTWTTEGSLVIPDLPRWVVEEIEEREQKQQRKAAVAGVPSALPSFLRLPAADLDEVKNRVVELADEVASAGQGGRNDTLLRNARMAFQYAEAGQIPHTDVEFIFEQAARAAGLDDSDMRTISNARHYAEGNPRAWQTSVRRTAAVPAPRKEESAPEASAADEPPANGPEQAAAGSSGGGGKEGGGTSDEPDDSFMYDVRSFPPDQMNQARYFCDYDGARLVLRWSLSAGTYMVYDLDRGHWRQDDTKYTVTGARLTDLGIRVSDATEREVAASDAMALLREGRTGDVKKEDIAAARQEISAMRAWAKVYTSAGGHSGILNYTRTLVDHCTALDFDTHSSLMNFSNGTYDVRTGTLRQHHMDDMLTHRVGWELDLDLAEKPLEEVAPHFHRLVSRMCAAPGEVSDDAAEKRVQAVLRLLGYTLHGSNPEKTMAVFVGGTDIGKNQVLEVVGQLLGNQLAWLGARPQLLIEGKGERHDAEEYGLAGRRLVLVNEMRQGQVLDEGQVLRFVGPEGTQVGLRKMRQDREDHWITWTMCVTTNELPRSRMTPQVVNRLTILQLSEVPVPKREQYDIKQAILTEEGPAVLAHLIAQWRAWYTAKYTQHSSTGLIRTEEMGQSLSSYAEDNRPLELEFMDECTERGAGIPLASASDLWARFQGWVREQHPNLRKEDMPGRNAFYAAIRTLDGQDGVEAVMEPKGGGKFQFRGLRGVRLLPMSVADMAKRYGI